MRREHVSWDEMLRALERGQARPDIERHCESCSPCRRVADGFRDLLARLQDTADSRPSPELVRATLARVREAIAQAADDGSRAGSVLERAGSKIREILARPSADSLRPAFAVRGAVEAAPRVVVYEAEGFAISVSRTSGPDGLAIRGQVIPRGGDALSEGRVELAVGERRWESPVSPHGEFLFRGLPEEDKPTLVVHLGDVRIRLASVPPAVTS